MASYETLLVTRPREGVVVVQLNRPRKWNALSAQLLVELVLALKEADRDDSCGCIIITGDERAFSGVLIRIDCNEAC